MKRKKGSIEVIFMFLLVIVFIVILSTMFMLQIQINSYIYPIKQDLFYIVQNVLVDVDNELLPYYNYSINESSFKSKINYLINKNHKNIDLESLYYNKESNCIDISLIVKIKPIVLLNNIKEFKLRIKDCIKLKDMEVSYD